MTTIILQGPILTADAARELANELNGTIEPRADHIRIITDNALPLERLGELRARAGFDINLLPEDFVPANARLLISDMDSTLINIECVDEIADFVGVKAQVAAITTAAMRGEMDFETSLQKRVALLKGLDASALQHVYDERLQLSPGAEALIDGLRKADVQIALVSGGFTFFTERLQKRLGLDFTLANRLEVEGGRITGQVNGSIVGAEAKAAFLVEVCDQLGIRPRQAIAVGDGANDLKMLNLAGLSVAFRGKPAVQAAAHVALNHSGLDGILAFLDEE